LPAIVRTARNAFVAFGLCVGVAGCFGDSGGAEGPQPQAATLAPWQPGRALIVDVDGDGRQEIVRIESARPGPGVPEGHLYVYHQATPGVFALPDVYPAGAYPSDVAVGDIDGDGLADLVVTDLVTPRRGNPAALHTLWFFHQDGGRRGRFAAPEPVAAGSNVVDVAIGDLDGDGRNDVLLVGAEGDLKVMLQSHSVPGQFDAARPIP
jgi:hypothetical protein